MNNEIWIKEQCSEANLGDKRPNASAAKIANDWLKTLQPVFLNHAMTGVD